jgi:hypothetical protein
MKFLFVILTGIFAVGMNLYAQELPNLNPESDLLEFSTQSEQAIIGQYPDFEVKFSSVLVQADYVVVDIRFDNKQLIAQINYQNETFLIQFVSLESGQLVKLTQADLHTFHALYENLLQHFSSADNPKVVDTLLRILNLLESHSPNEFLNVSKIKGYQPRARTSICAAIGTTKAASYDIDGTTYSDTVTVGPCGSDSCLGRCGAGCSGIGRGMTFTQDCLNHDVCCDRLAKLHPGASCSSFLGECGDEWNDAVDDFLFGHDCADDVKVRVIHISSGTGCNTTVPVKFKIKNTGTFFDTFNLTTTNCTWPCSVSSPIGPINAGEEQVATVNVNIPSSCSQKQLGSATLTATSQCNTQTSDSANGTPIMLLVEIIAFGVIPYENALIISWETALEINNTGFNVWRSETEEGEYIKINDPLIPAEGNDSKYNFVDNTVIRGNTYYYKLEDIDTNGVSTFRSAANQPDNVLIIGPKHRATLTSEQSPTFEWRSDTYSLFKFEYSTDNGQTIQEVPVAEWMEDTSLTPPIAAWQEFAQAIKESMVLWRIVGTNEQGRDFSEVRSFTIE